MQCYIILWRTNHDFYEYSWILSKKLFYVFDSHTNTSLKRTNYGELWNKVLIFQLFSNFSLKIFEFQKLSQFWKKNNVLFFKVFIWSLYKSKAFLADTRFFTTVYDPTCIFFNVSLDEKLDGVESKTVKIYSIKPCISLSNLIDNSTWNQT